MNIILIKNKLYFNSKFLEVFIKKKYFNKCSICRPFCCLTKSSLFSKFEKLVFKSDFLNILNSRIFFSLNSSTVFGFGLYTFALILPLTEKSHGLRSGLLGGLIL